MCTYSSEGYHLHLSVYKLCDFCSGFLWYIFTDFYLQNKAVIVYV